MRPRAELDLPLVLDRTAVEPLHQQLAGALRRAVLDGLLATGSRLPPSRLLGAELGVARSTVLSAYDQLAGEGYLETRHGSGTFVPAQVHAAPPAHRRAAPNAAAEDELPLGSVDLRPGRPDTDRLVDGAWRAAWRTAAAGAQPPFEPPLQGLPALREQLAAHLRTARGVAADPADVFVTAGTGEGLALVVHALDGPAPTVAVEDPGYPSARRLLARLGCTLQPVAVDGDGLLVERLAGLPAPPRLALVTPSHQYPLGGRLPVGRRLALLTWARDADALILEDDYDSEFRFETAPLPALASLDDDGHGRVLHLGTFSKVLTPWLRAGYLLAPARLRPALLSARRDLGSPVSGLDQQALASYLAGGALRRHIARVRRDYAHRRRHLTWLLDTQPQLSLHGAQAGLHAVIELPSGTETADVLQRCAQRGFLLADLGDYEVGFPTRSRPAVVLGYGDASLTELDGAVMALAEAVSAPGRRA